MNNRSAVHMLHDFISDTFERGQEAKQTYLAAKANAPDDPDTMFQSGVVLTYYTILDALFNRIKSFGLEDQVPIMAELNLEELLNDSIPQPEC